MLTLTKASNANVYTLICGLGAIDDFMVSIEKTHGICAFDPVGLDPVFVCLVLVERLLGAHCLDPERDVITCFNMVHAEAHHGPVKAFNTLWGNSGAAGAFVGVQVLTVSALEVDSARGDAAYLEDLATNGNMGRVNLALVSVGVKGCAEGRVFGIILRG